MKLPGLLIIAALLSLAPLPGWRLTYVSGIAVTYALRDTTDPCGYTLSSNDPQVIPPTARTMPLS